jgi:hypothetical protein
MASHCCDLIVPVDDRGASALFEAHNSRALDEVTGQVVQRSLGDPLSFRIRHARAVIAASADEAGRGAPDVAGAPPAVSRIGWLVLDKDASYLRSCLLRTRPSITLHECLVGEQDALSAVAWEGT